MIDPLILGALVAVLATCIEPKGVRKIRWWVVMITLNLLLTYLL